MPPNNHKETPEITRERLLRILEKTIAEERDSNLDLNGDGGFITSLEIAQGNLDELNINTGLLNNRKNIEKNLKKIREYLVEQAVEHDKLFKFDPEPWSRARSIIKEEDKPLVDNLNKEIQNKKIQNKRTKFKNELTKLNEILDKEHNPSFKGLRESLNTIDVDSIQSYREIEQIHEALRGFNDQLNADPPHLKDRVEYFIKTVQEIQQESLTTQQKQAQENSKVQTLNTDLRERLQAAIHAASHKNTARHHRSLSRQEEENDGIEVSGIHLTENEDSRRSSLDSRTSNSSRRDSIQSTSSESSSNNDPNSELLRSLDDYSRDSSVGSYSHESPQQSADEELKEWVDAIKHDYNVFYGTNKNKLDKNNKNKNTANGELSIIAAYAHVMKSVDKLVETHLDGNDFNTIKESLSNTALALKRYYSQENNFDKGQALIAIANKLTKDLKAFEPRRSAPPSPESDFINENELLGFPDQSSETSRNSSDGSINERDIGVESVKDSNDEDLGSVGLDEHEYEPKNQQENAEAWEEEISSRAEQDDDKDEPYETMPDESAQKASPNVTANSMLARLTMKPKPLDASAAANNSLENNREGTDVPSKSSVSTTSLSLTKNPTPSPMPIPVTIVSPRPSTSSAAAASASSSVSASRSPHNRSATNPLSTSASLSQSGRPKPTTSTPEEASSSDEEEMGLEARLARLLNSSNGNSSSALRDVKNPAPKPKKQNKNKAASGSIPNSAATAASISTGASSSLSTAAAATGPSFNSLLSHPTVSTSGSAVSPDSSSSVVRPTDLNLFLELDRNLFHFERKQSSNFNDEQRKFIDEIQWILGSAVNHRTKILPNETAEKLKKLAENFNEFSNYTKEKIENLDFSPIHTALAIALSQVQNLASVSSSTATSTSNSSTVPTNRNQAPSTSKHPDSQRHDLNLPSGSAAQTSENTSSSSWGEQLSNIRKSFPRPQNSHLETENDYRHPSSSLKAATASPTASASSSSYNRSATNPLNTSVSLPQSEQLRPSASTSDEEASSSSDYADSSTAASRLKSSSPPSNSISSRTPSPSQTSSIELLLLELENNLSNFRDKQSSNFNNEQREFIIEIDRILNVAVSHTNEGLTNKTVEKLTKLAEDFKKFSGYTKEEIANLDFYPIYAALAYDLDQTSTNRHQAPLSTPSASLAATFAGLAEKEREDKLSIVDPKLAHIKLKIKRGIVASPAVPKPSNTSRSPIASSPRLFSRSIPPFDRNAPPGKFNFLPENNLGTSLEERLYKVKNKSFETTRIKARNAFTEARNKLLSRSGGSEKDIKNANDAGNEAIWGYFKDAVKASANKRADKVEQGKLRTNVPLAGSENNKYPSEIRSKSDKITQDIYQGKVILPHPADSNIMGLLNKANQNIIAEIIRNPDNEEVSCRFNENDTDFHDAVIMVEQLKLRYQLPPGPDGYGAVEIDGLTKGAAINFWNMLVEAGLKPEFSEQQKKTLATYYTTKTGSPIDSSKIEAYLLDSGNCLPIGYQYPGSLKYSAKAAAPAPVPTPSSSPSSSSRPPRPRSH